MTQTSYKAIAEIIARRMGKESPADLAAELAAYLVSERRASDLGKIMREVERIRFAEGLLEIDVSSAREITGDIEQQVKAMFDAKSIMLNKNIDESLVGGVKIQAQDTLIDLSVRGQLNRLKTRNF